MRGILREAVLGVSSLVSRGLSRPLLAGQKLTGGWRVPILLYHQVSESGSSPGYPWRVTPAMFESQMRWLAEEGYTVLALAEFLDACQKGRVAPRSVVLTFDDGFRGVFLHAYPILKRYGFPATLFLATGPMGQSDFPWIRHWLKEREDPEEYRPLAWQEVRALRGPLITLGSHTVTHPHLGRLARSEMEWEILESRRQIERETGSTVTFFAYPGGIGLYGDQTPETRGLLQASGYACALVSEIGRSGPSSDPFRLRRVGVGVNDSLALFRAKVVGAFSWVRAVQWGAHRAFSDPSDY